MMTLFDRELFISKCVVVDSPFRETLLVTIVFQWFANS
jgi:hypothetical protein